MENLISIIAMLLTFWGITKLLKPPKVRTDSKVHYHNRRRELRVFQAWFGITVGVSIGAFFLVKWMIHCFF